MPGFALLLAPIFSVFGCANRLDPDETAWSGLQASRMPALPRSRRSDRRSISTASVSGSLEAGSGDPVIFVHGVVTTSNIFPNYIGAYQPDFRGIAVDLHGLRAFG